MRTVKEVESFLQSLGEPKFLIEGCKRYFDYEPRDAVYTVVLDYISCHGARFERATAVTALLLSWNARYYATHPQQKSKVAESIEVKLTKTEDLAAFENDGLASPRFDEQFDEVARVFDLFNDESMGLVGASKALHVLKPALFIPWDNSILEGYHRLHPKFGRFEKDEECYAEFLRQCRTASLSVLSRVTERDLARQHPAFVHFNQQRRITKMIDECNYCFFTGHKDWIV
jgi:hypothetical protein